MLGSLHDAEDAFQETMLRAWRGLPRFHGRSGLRSWLFRIATNVCIDAIKRRPPRMASFEDGPPTDLGRNAPTQAPREPVWMKFHRDQDLGVEDTAMAPEARYERRESVKRAVIVAREHLPARQRNVLILRDVLGFSAKEAAVILETTVAAINSALPRARQNEAVRPHGAYALTRPWTWSSASSTPSNRATSTRSSRSSPMRRRSR
jgi:RNA polymerase sigma-70 factor (ECF subfamily)